MGNKKNRNLAKKLRKKQQKLASKNPRVSGEYDVNLGAKNRQRPRAIEQLNYEVTWDPIEEEVKASKLPKEVEQQKQAIYHQLQNQDTDIKQLIETLDALCVQYPDDKILSNYLCSAYLMSGDFEKGKQLIKENFEKRPDYLFARMQLAECYLEEKSYDEFYNLFDGKFDLKLLCPERDVFHISEVKSMLSIVAQYAGHTNNEDLFVQHYRALYELDSDDPALLNLMPLLMSFYVSGMNKNALEL